MFGPQLGGGKSRWTQGDEMTRGVGGDSLQEVVDLGGGGGGGEVARMRTPVYCPVQYSVVLGPSAVQCSLQLQCWC